MIQYVPVSQTTLQETQIKKKLKNRLKIIGRDFRRATVTSNPMSCDGEALTRSITDDVKAPKQGRELGWNGLIVGGWFSFHQSFLPAFFIVLESELSGLYRLAYLRLLQIPIGSTTKIQRAVLTHRGVVPLITITITVHLLRQEQVQCPGPRNKRSE